MSQAVPPDPHGWRTGATMKVAMVAAVFAAVLAVAASAGGLVWPGLYRDNGFVRAAWMGFDLTTLCVGLPVLATSMRLAARGSLRALLVWLGLLDYLTYGYAYYLVGAAFNELFLVYAGIVVSSSMALVFALVNLDARTVGTTTARRYDRWVAGYMWFVAGGLSTVYVAQSVAFVTSGTMPAIVSVTGHPTSVVFALDLTLVVPPLAIAAVLLWRGHAWGRIVGAIVNVKGAIYTCSLGVSSLIALRNGFADAGNEIPLWITLTAGNAIAAFVLIAGIRPVAGK